MKTSISPRQVEIIMKRLIDMGETKLAWKFYRLAFKRAVYDLAALKLRRINKSLNKQFADLDDDVAIALFKKQMKDL